MDFNLAYIPADFDEKSREEFDPKYMKKLFDMAFDRASAATHSTRTSPSKCQQDLVLTRFGQMPRGAALLARLSLHSVDDSGRD
ncbi:MAG: hypothetical protein AMJ62_08245 [Myxococcales bacterium SG8_38]|nr:MAG: hypothetical protein AMJ62_08245 [Myxococcales bacterium SG8_38]